MINIASSFTTLAFLVDFKHKPLSVKLIILNSSRSKFSKELLGSNLYLAWAILMLPAIWLCVPFRWSSSFRYLRPPPGNARVLLIAWISVHHDLSVFFLGWFALIFAHSLIICCTCVPPQIQLGFKLVPLLLLLLYTYIF